MSRKTWPISPDGRNNLGLETLADEQGRMLGLDPLKVWEATPPKQP